MKRHRETETIIMDTEQDERMGLPSASNLPILANCTGSRNLVAAILASGEMPPEVADSVRDSGIDIHAAMETSNFDELPPDEKEIAARLKRLETIALSEWLMEKRTLENPTEEPEILREQRLWMRRKNLQPIASAKIDFGATLETSGLVLDFKSGYANPTPSEVNWQCKTQAVCLWHEKPHLTHIRAGIVASRLTEKLDVSDYDLAGLRAAEWEIKNVIAKSELPDAPTNPGHWCRYCPAKPFCRSFAAWTQVEVVPFSGMSQLDVVLSVSKLAPSELKKIHAKKTLIKELLDAVDNRLRNMTDDELLAIGLKKKPGNKPRAIAYNSKAIAALTEGDNPIVTAGELLLQLKIPVGTIDKLVMEHFGIPKKSVEEKTAEVLGDALIRTENKTSIEAI